MAAALLTFLERFEVFGQLSHVLLELDTLLLLIVILGIGFEVNLGHFLVLTIELVQFKDWVGLTLRVRGIVAELVSLSVFLDANFVALFAQAKIESIATVNS